METTEVRLHTLLTEVAAIFLLLIQVAKGVREANAHVYHLVLLLFGFSMIIEETWMRTLSG